MADELRSDRAMFRALTVECPHCGARPGKRCRDFLGGTARRMHVKRLRAANEAGNPAAKEGHQ